MVQLSIKALAGLIILLLPEAALAAQSFAMRPGITREVTSGTTDTAGFGDIGSQISWTSISAAPKIETLPACGSTIQGLPIIVADGAGTAATYPITVNAASGNVGGSSAGVTITGNFQGLLFTCDGPSTNWVIAGVSPGAGAITWPNLNGESTCTITGVGSPKVFTPICANNYITIDAAGEVINVPSNMPPNPLPPPGTPSASNAISGYALFITYSGTFTPTFPGAQWQSKTAPVACGGTVTTNCLSSTSGANDLIIGKSLGASSIVYGAVITNFGVPTYTFDQSRNTGGLITLSNGNLTTKYTGATGSQAITVTTGFHSAGVYVFEMTLTACGDLTACQIGAANSSETTNDTTKYLGKTTNSVGITASSGAVFINAVQVGTITSWAVGAVVDVKIDLTGKLISNQVNGGGFSSAVSIATLSSFNLSPATNFHTLNDIWNINASPTGVAGALPW